MTKISNQYSLTNILTADLANSRLGINNVSPTVALDVTGAGKFSGVVTLNSNEPLILNRANNTSTSNAIRFQTGGTTQWYVGSDSYLQSGTENFGFYNGSYKLTITSTGNVGIGTTSPTNALTVASTASYVAEFYRNNNADSRINITNTTTTSGTDKGLMLGEIGVDSYFYNYAAGAAIFGTSALERMRITSTGNVGIGTSSPFSNAKLQVKTGTDINLAFQTGTTDSTGIKLNAFNDAASVNIPFELNGSILILKTAEAERMRITSGGFTKMSNDGTYNGSTGAYHEIRSNISGNYSVQISNTNASPFGLMVYYPNLLNNTTNRFIDCEDSTALRFSVRSNGGIANYSANNVSLSDERTKKDIVPLESYWDKFKSIEMVKFKYKDQTHDDYNIGVIAQQVEQVAPEFVDVDGWGETPEDGIPLKSIYTADLYHATIKVLQEAMIKIEELSAKVSLLENK